MKDENKCVFISSFIPHPSSFSKPAPPNPDDLVDHRQEHKEVGHGTCPDVAPVEPLAPLADRDEPPLDLDGVDVLPRQHRTAVVQAILADAEGAEIDRLPLVVRTHGPRV